MPKLRPVSKKKAQSQKRRAAGQNAFAEAVNRAAKKHGAKMPERANSFEIKPHVKVKPITAEKV